MSLFLRFFRDVTFITCCILVLGSDANSFFKALMGGLLTILILNYCMWVLAGFILRRYSDSSDSLIDQANKIVEKAKKF